MTPVAVALTVIGLGLATNQVTRILRHGSLFEWLRNCINWRSYCAPDCVQDFLYRLFDCHLCLGQEVAVALTWTSLAMYILLHGQLPWEQTLVAVFIGPLVVGGVDQLIEMVREFQKKS